MQHPDKESHLTRDQNLNVQGFSVSYVKSALTAIGVLLSCGLLCILMLSRKKFLLLCTHNTCCLKDAQKVLIVDSYGTEYMANVEKASYGNFFYYKRIKYLFNRKISTFKSVGGLDNFRCSQLHSLSKGLKASEAKEKLERIGPNAIRINVKPILKLLLRELRNPFYIYQVFIIIVWCIQLYYQFAICITLLCIGSVSATIWETRKQSRSLRNAMQVKFIATVLRDGKEVLLPSEDLVPGDIVILPKATFTMSCDAVLLSGSCVVNESMLTGESTPITKVSITNENSYFDDVIHKRSILSCGTQVLISRDMDSTQVKAIVYRTGFSTAKGELVRAILYPKPVKWKLYSDLVKCMIVFFILGIPSLGYAIKVGMELELHTYDVVLVALNVCTFFVPPSLPAVLTSINQQAQRRLREKGIYCLNTRYINFSGLLDIVCFDKTGTLTEDNLDILVMEPVCMGKFEDPTSSVSGFSNELFVQCLATCHSLCKVKGELLGHDMDMKMLKITEWDIEEPTDKSMFEHKPPRIAFPKCSEVPKKPVAIVRQFPFESSLKRMCVITQTEESSRFQVFLKGAPELVTSFCKKDTVPNDIGEVLERYTCEGFRVIALATKTLSKNTSWKDVQEIQRQKIETDLQFLGLVVFENRLKKETIPALFVLKEADIRLVMVTGDNLLTAITVGRKCGIMHERDDVVIVEAKLVPESTSGSDLKLEVNYRISPSPISKGKVQFLPFDNEKFQDIYIPIQRNENRNIALDGESFNLLRLYDADLLDKVVMKGAIFARMSPENKLHLIEKLQDLGYLVGMCGDGANDCGALKTAHTGVSLSLAEASVAAPFTSTQKNIQCISTLIREGRAALVSTFDSFRYMVCYTLTFLLAVLFIFWDGQKPVDGEYITNDIVLNLIPPFLFGLTTSCPNLSKQKPLRSILSFIPIFSVVSFMLIQIGVHTLAYSYCLSQPWYTPFNLNKEDVSSPEPSYTGTSIFSVNMMSYVTAAAIFASGPPFRNSFLSNKLYVAVMVAEFLLVSYLIVYPPDFMVHYLNFKRAPTLKYHLILYVIALCSLSFCFVYEKYFVQHILKKYVVDTIQRQRGPVKKYEKLKQELREDLWLPI